MKKAGEKARFFVVRARGTSPVSAREEKEGRFFGLKCKESAYNSAV